MKTHAVIFLSCLCSISAITVQYQAPQTSDKPTKEYKTALKDIRLVPTSQIESVQKFPKAKEESKRQDSQVKPRGDKKKFSSSISRVGSTQNLQTDPAHQQYMQKMANQLYLAQKHASLLSDYQKFILNQDENVKNFVLAPLQQERNPKPFSRKRPAGRALPVPATVKHVSQEPVAATTTADYKKIVVVTPKVETIISKPENDHSAQPTQIKYVTVAPQSLSHFAATPKVTLVPYHSSPQYTFYDLGVTAKPHVVQIPTTAVSLGLSSYESPKYYTSEGGHNEDFHHDTNYEFMYNVKDHEKHNHFGHKESRTDKTTYGFYFVHLPDGRLETVKYWADKTGYHAKVDYQGEAKHPTHSEHKLHTHNFVHH